MLPDVCIGSIRMDLHGIGQRSGAERERRMFGGRRKGREGCFDLRN